MSNSNFQNLVNTRISKHKELNGKNYPLPSSGVSISEIIRIASNLEASSNLKTNLDVANSSDNLELFTVHGRITNLRKSGGIAFAKLLDSSGAIQLIFSKSNFSDFQKIKLYDLGDVVEVSGFICISSTNEKSLFVKEMRLLSKCINPPPEKWEGIQDKELQYKKRYLELMSSEDAMNRFKIVSSMNKFVRSFFEMYDFMEVETSILSSIPSGASATPFSTKHMAYDQEMFLRIAPELSLKKLIVGGFDKIYEFGKNFRNEGISTRHSPEFSSVEFYQTYASCRDMMDYTKKFLVLLNKNLLNHPNNNIANAYSKLSANHSFTFDHFVEITYDIAIRNGLDKVEASIDSFGKIHYFNENNERLSKIDVNGLQYKLSSSPSSDKIKEILFETFAEPFFQEDYRNADSSKSLPVMVYDFPLEISPLARKKDGSKDIADRFELYIGGMEVANGFQEINDPSDQRIRFEEQAQSSDPEAMKIDESFIEALEYGMPPTSGCGWGMSRINQLLTCSENIRDVIFFPVVKI